VKLYEVEYLGNIMVIRSYPFVKGLVCGVQDILYTFQAMDTVSILRRPWGIWGLTEIVWSGRNMRTGPRTSLSEVRIDYKELRKINPEAARIALTATSTNK
jgi:hypothetical protein